MNEFKEEWRVHENGQSGNTSALRRSITKNEQVFTLFSRLAGSALTIHTILFLELDQPLSRASLLARLYEAWIDVRSELPIIGAQIPKNVQYTIEVQRDPSDPALKEWASQTIELEESEDQIITVASIARTIIAPAIPDAHGNNALVRCVVPKAKETFTSVALSVWLSHDLFDGPSTRIVVSNLRRSLAKPGKPDQKQLLGLTSCILESEWGTASSQSSPVFMKRVAAGEKNIVYKTKDATKPRPPIPCVHAFRRLSKDETKGLVSYCHKYGLTASPVILAALLIRTIIDRITDWPLPIDTVFSQILPTDPRSVLSDPRAVGLHSVYGVVLIPIGEILRGRSKEDIEQDVARVIHEAAVSANLSFADLRPKKSRAEGVMYNEANLASLMPAIESGAMDLSTTLINVYPDSVLGEPSLQLNISPSPDGIGSTIKDVYMHVKCDMNTIFGRTWIFEGQTTIALNLSEAFIKEEEVSAMVSKWKKDLLDLTRVDF